ncbi:Uncharacterised protein [uncultured archaeon]|nr:Uncharacterised protein [uncultured archaeon]
MQYKVTKADLEKSFKFSVDYHLYPSHPGSNRTTGQARGLGGVLDSFLVGKVVELAVSNILKGYVPSKEFNPDFEMHSKKEQIDDPDINKITESGVVRKPRVYIEIKNIGEADRWLGLTAEQFRTIKLNPIVGDDLKKIVLIYATIRNITNPNKKADDLLGVFLKDEINSSLTRDFAGLDGFVVEINAVITGEELDSKGIKFDKGKLMLETDVFEELNYAKYKREVSKEGTVLKKMELGDNKLPKYRFNNDYEYAPEYGDFLIDGEVNVYKKDNRKSTRVYLLCDTDCLVRNSLLGDFELKKDRAYLFKPGPVGRNPVLNRNNVLIPRTNLVNIASESVETRLKKLAEEI